MMKQLNILDNDLLSGLSLGDKIQRALIFKYGNLRAAAKELSIKNDDYIEYFTFLKVIKGESPNKRIRAIICDDLDIDPETFKSEAEA